MIRSLRCLTSMAMAVLALGVLGASAAQASTFQSLKESAGELTITTTPDGTLKTAHHVIDFSKNVTMTCASMSADGVLKPPAASLTLEPTYNECSFNGAAKVPVKMNGCDYVFYANGEFEIASSAGNNCGLNKISISANGCTVFIGPQKLKGITYHNINPSGVNEEITLEMALNGLASEVVGAGCAEVGAFKAGEYTTGNTILTGAEKANPNVMVGIKWE